MVGLIKAVYTVQIRFFKFAAPVSQKVSDMKQVPLGYNNCLSALLCLAAHNVWVMFLCPLLSNLYTKPLKCSVHAYRT